LGTVQLRTFAAPPGLWDGHLHAGPSFADAVVSRLAIAPLESQGWTPPACTAKTAA
jgi:hypothetical protein